MAPGQLLVSEGKWFSEPRGTLVINIADALSLARHPDPARWSGCCGPDGLDGANMVCACGNEVATQKADCWMPHALIFELGAVRLG